MWQVALEVMVLLVVANAAPIIAARVLRSSLEGPVDSGVRLADEQPLFGASKTWRGLVAALLACAVAGPLMGFGLGFSLLFASLAMAGDLLSTKNGWHRLIWFMVLFNVNLAVLNMLPLPVLDGG